MHPNQPSPPGGRIKPFSERKRRPRKKDLPPLPPPRNDGLCSREGCGKPATKTEGLCTGCWYRHYRGQPPLDSVAKVERQARRELAMSLRLQGKSYTEIAREMGSNVTAVARLVANEMDRMARRANEDVEQIRKLELARIDSVVDALWPGRKDPKTALAILAAMDRRAKYIAGLDVPKKTELDVRTMSDADLMREVKLIAESRAALCLPSPALPPSRAGNEIVDVEVVPAEQE